MATPSSFEWFDVLPRNHEALPDSTKYDLSDIDQLVTGHHTTPCIVYPFSGSKEGLVRNLRAGLQNVLTWIPLVGGELLNEGGRLSVVRRNHEPVRLHVHHLDGDPDFPTYEAIAAKGFPADFFTGNVSRLLPPGSNLAGFRRDNGCPVAVFQVNFIAGGVILVLPLHHNCGDAKSIDHTFGLWAASSRAAAENAPMPEFRPYFDRSYFTAASTPSPEAMQAIRQNLRGFSVHPISEDTSKPLTEPAKPPPTSITMYHFSAAASADLKKTCWPAAGSGVDFVSSYDVVSGLTWRAMTRARTPMLKPDLATATTEYAHPIDTRGRFGGEVPDEYFGNGFTMVPTDPILIADILGEGGLARAAQLIRRSIQGFNARTIPDFVSFRRGIEGKEEVRWTWHPENIVGTSWMAMRTMWGYDFGFGLPASLRLPVPPFEGVLGVLPASRVGPDAGDGFDVYVVLEIGCQERLRRDPEFAKYCSVVGE